MSRQRRLGKGIDALLQGRDLGSLETGDINSVVSVPIDNVRPNPDQPRKSFSPEALDELARSIEERGIIQPILAEQGDDGTYVIIAGERRYRAAKLAGLTVVPVLPGVFSEDEKLEIALIENIQRQNLTPIEEARAYRDLMERSGGSQEELAHRLGKSRSAVANAVRLLRLPEAIQERVNDGSLSAGHARTLLALNEAGHIGHVADLIVRDDLSVRIVEQLVALINDGVSADSALAHITRPADMENGGADGRSYQNKDIGDYNSPGSHEERHTSSSARAGSGDGGSRKSVEMMELEQRLMEHLGTRVLLHGTNDRGKIEITYLSMDDLERLVELVAPGVIGTD